MVTTDDKYQPAADPNPSRPVDLDFPTLGRLVEAEGSDLHDRAAQVHDALVHLSRVGPGSGSMGAVDDQGAGSCSPEELIALLNGIGAAAYRLARHVRTLVDFQAIHRARTGDRGDR